MYSVHYRELKTLIDKKRKRIGAAVEADDLALPNSPNPWPIAIGATVIVIAIVVIAAVSSTSGGAGAGAGSKSNSASIPLGECFYDVGNTTWLHEMMYHDFANCSAFKNTTKNVSNVFAPLYSEGEIGVPNMTVFTKIISCFEMSEICDTDSCPCPDADSTGQEAVVELSRCLCQSHRKETNICLENDDDLLMLWNTLCIQLGG